ncbi:MAG: acyl-CoA dehydratase activase [Gemmatimonadota bacterium]
MVVGGVDVGSTQTKAVLLDENRRIVGRALTQTGAHVVRAAERSFGVSLEDAGLEAHDVGYVIGTGYGRYKVTFGDDQVTEISCHAKGASFVFPGTTTVLDIGGQDTKAIRVDEGGEVLDFCMNDKCAAGTGRFLEAAAEVMGLELSEIGPLSLEARVPIKITNVCTVFVETEILSHLARGRKVSDVLAGVHRAIARRAVGLIRRIGLEPQFTFTGGVSRNPGMRAALEERLGSPLNASEDSHYMGAIGAALFAWERAHRGAGSEVAA